MSGIQIIPLLMGVFAAVFVLTSPAASQSLAPTPTLPPCLIRLAAIGIKAEQPTAPPASPLPACVIDDPVALISAAPRAGDSIIFSDRPLLSCAMAGKLGRFSVEVASPMALSAFGKPIASLSTGPGYECRPRNRRAGAKVSSSRAGQCGGYRRDGDGRRSHNFR